MKTEYGYDDTTKYLTLAQWNRATTEQRSGLLAEGYVVIERPSALAELEFIVRTHRAYNQGLGK